jgi:serine/threonine-protein kinase HipA
MSETLAVLLDDRVAGTLTRVPRGRLRFDYDEDYRARADAVPLSLSMPTQVRSHADATVTPWLWGLLPENDAVLERWARQFHASTSSPFSLLATPIGEDCAGAVRFAAHDETARLLEQAGEVTWLTDTEVAERLRELKVDSTAWLGESFTGQFSLAGAQAKTALLFQDGRWGVPSGSTPTSHILKPAVAGFDDHDLNEHLCLSAARNAGLVAARTWIRQFDDQSAIVVERYDRLPSRDRIIRIHQEDLCQALGFPPGRKYQNEGGPTPKQIVGLLRQAMPSRAADEAVWRFVDALAWNWLIAGTDAHSKNYSLLLSGSEVRLAPLYDVASALPYKLHEKELRLAMKIGKHYEVFNYNDPWPQAAKDLGLDTDELLTRVADLATRTPDAFKDATEEQKVVELKRDLPVRLRDRVSERVARCLDLLGTGAEVPTTG